jgi:hypothetical protein
MDLLSRISANLSRDAAEGDVALYHSVLLYGEYAFKVVILTMVSALEIDREGHRYRQLHALVRANSLGEWVRIADETLSGPAAAHVATAARPVFREWTQTVDERTWQYAAIRKLWEALRDLEPSTEALPAVIQGRRWLTTFAQFRNASLRGHGVESPQQISRIVHPLRRSIELVATNSTIFGLQFAHLHRNLSGKYRVTALSSDISAFSYLRSDIGAEYPNGTYVAFDEQTLQRIELIDSGMA